MIMLMIMNYDYDLWICLMIMIYDYDLSQNPSLGPTSAGMTTTLKHINFHPLQPALQTAPAIPAKDPPPAPTVGQHLSELHR